MECPLGSYTAFAASLYVAFKGSPQGIKTAHFVANQCRERGHEVFLVDPYEFRLPLLDKMYKEYPPGGAPELLEHLAERVKAADAYVIVSGRLTPLRQRFCHSAELPLGLRSHEPPIWP